ncbi:MULTISPECIES: tetratricopeptide repeat-containing sensor histidine kinase [Flavobacterium]|uniref:histidine kinase n=1 Tax=Flavobacterium jumunjinense TaxID=998845 RepID=A0ABV5GT76_9FLAO|nr:MULTISPECIES: tetratricopeptide repeat-containing sensor histidine kinase [Flavobacterium]
MKIPKFFIFISFLFLFCKKNNEILPLDDDLKQAQFLDSIKQYEKAFSFYNKSYEYNKLINDKKRMLFCLLKEAEIQTIFCDYNAAQESATNAISLFDKNTSIDYRTNGLISLGTSYLNLNDYDKAINVYSEVLDITPNLLTKIITENNIAVTYLEKKNYQKAIEILKPLLKSDILKKHKAEYARVLDNLGYAYFNLGIKKEAHQYISESLRIKDSIGKDYEKIAPLMHLARFYEDSIPKESSRFAINAYDIATRVNSPDDRLEALDILIRNTSSRDDFKSYYKKFHSLKDSIDLVRRIAKNEFANIKFNSDKAIKEKEKEANEKKIIAIIFIIFIIIAILLFLLIRSKNKRKLLKTAYDTETRISKRLHDELANDVFNTMMYLETQDLVEQTKKDKVLGNLENIYEKARNISKQTSGVKTGKDFGTLVDEMLTSYKSEQVNVIKKGNNTINWEVIAAEKQIEIHRVLQEVLVNMKKHSDATLVVIVFESLEKSIRIKYSDNGIGFDMEKISKNGVRNMENRMHSINGSITFDSEINKGVKINIEFPK